MLRFQGQPQSLCDGVSRREILRLGSLGALGITLPTLLTASTQSRAEDVRASASLEARARAVILVYLFGGPSQLDTFDLKPEAPSDFRGEFRPITTNVPGISICEHFPLLAATADKFALIRSMNHGHPRHGYGLYYMFTGREHPRPDLDAPPTPNDFPSIGSLVAKVAKPRGAFPPAVTLPRWNRFLDVPNDYAGETAGFLGPSYDPWLLKADPGSADFQVSGIEMPLGLTLDRLGDRRDLLTALDRRIAEQAESIVAAQHDSLYRQAFSLVTSPQARQAFDIGRESAATRESYGRTPFGQGLLVARRMVEAGATLITVNWHNDGSDVKSPFWDTHKDNFVSLRERLMPPADRGIAALLTDLDQRGLLASTMVVVMGEFGRTPKIGRVVMNAATNASGRDHWPHAYTVLIAGGGVRGGQVYGASDARGAYVTDAPVTPPDLVATVLDALGIDLSTRIFDQQGRPQSVCEGKPVVGLF